MEPDQQEALDQQVEQVMQALQAAGEPITAEGVRQRVGRRMTDTLAAMKRLTRGTTAPEVDANTPPEHDPRVQTAAAKVAQLTEAVAVAEVDVTAAEQAYAQTESQAAEALIDGREPISLMEAQQAVLHAAETVRLLALAQSTAKERYAAALTEAQARHWAAQWQAYQGAVQAFDAALAVAYAAQTEAMRQWNAIGQPQEPPLLKGPLSIYPSDFHPFLQEMILDLAAEQVNRGSILSGGLPPRPY